MQNKIPSYLYKSEPTNERLKERENSSLSFLDKTIQNAAKAVKSIYEQADNALRENFIHKINPHVKLISLIYLVVIISLINDHFAQMLITAFIFVLFVLSKMKIFEIYKKIFILSFIFGFLIVIPASLNVISPGKIIFTLITFKKSSHIWIYNIPEKIGFTDEGLQVVSLLFLRVLNSISISLLIIFTTSFSAFIKSFKIFGVPDTFLMIVMLAYKFIFILSNTIEETYVALKSKLIGNINSRHIRKLISGRVFYIFRKSRTTYENTYYAMASRGYTGKIYLHTKKQIVLSDIFALLIVVAFGIGILFI